MLFLQLMDELFGASGIGTAPPGTICATPLCLEDPPSQNRPTISLPQAQAAGASVDEQPGTSASTSLSSRQRWSQPSQFWDIRSACREKDSCASVPCEAWPGEMAVTKGEAQMILWKKDVDQLGNDCGGAKENRKTTRANCIVTAKPTWTTIKCLYDNSI